MIDLRWAAAYHEAAHAVMSAALGEPIFSIEISDHGGGLFRNLPPQTSAVQEQQDLYEALARWRGAASETDRSLIEKKCLVCLAGPVVDRLLVSEEFAAAGAGTDHRHARSFIAALPVSEQRQAALFADLDQKAARIVEQNWPTIAALATHAYCSDGRMLEPQIREVLRMAQPRDELVWR